MSGELHATFAESSPGGTHALPLVAPPVAQPVAPPVAAPVAQPVTRQRPGTVNTVAANDLRKPHRDRSRDHAQARNETTTSNTDFPAPASRKVTINQHVLSILHVGSHHLQHRLSHATKPKNYHKTNTFCPLTPNRHITNTFCPLTPSRHITNTFCPLTLNPRDEDGGRGGVPLVGTRGFLGATGK